VPRVQNLGRSGTVSAVDYFDCTVKLAAVEQGEDTVEPIGWVPIGAVQGLEDYGIGAAKKGKGMAWTKAKTHGKGKSNEPLEEEAEGEGEQQSAQEVEDEASAALMERPSVQASRCSIPLGWLASYLQRHSCQIEGMSGAAPPSMSSMTKRDVELLASAMVSFVDCTLDRIKREQDSKIGDGDGASRESKEKAKLTDIGSWEGKEFISRRPVSIDHVEDKQGENWVVSFDRPTLMPSGDVGTAVWYSCHQYGHDHAKKLAFRHVPRQEDAVSKIRNSKRTEDQEAASSEPPRKRLLRTSDLSDVFK